MPVRNIVEINEALCTGCGLCVIDCVEGALQIVNGKAKVIKESFCDGLGACIGSCPEGALKIIEREADAFDEEAVEQYMENQKQAPPTADGMACGCPGSMLRTFKPADAPVGLKSSGEKIGEEKSRLAQWPVQLRLLPTSGPLYANKDLVLIADCVAVADPALHRRLIDGNTILITCPKLDDNMESINKLAHIFANPLKSISVAIMEVPCCGGLVRITREAARIAGRQGAMHLYQIGIQGSVLREEDVPLT
jgi:NAD-dependent dihydropyrimidine dehydrogenase PreA subunit